VHETTRWRLINILRCRYQRDVHTDQALVELGVIQTVTGQPIDLVNDEVANAKRRQLTLSSKSKL
jgi:hypothetical protein